MIEKFIQDTLIIWATIDPIGTMALFAALTARLSPADRQPARYRNEFRSTVTQGTSD